VEEIAACSLDQILNSLGIMGRLSLIDVSNHVLHHLKTSLEYIQIKIMQMPWYNVEDNGRASG
jgi:hypothetical protein